MSPDSVETITPLPALKRALERRYPGVRIGVCEWRRYTDKTGEGYSISFYAANAETLIRHGLARRDPRRLRKLLATGPETTCGGTECSNHSWVVHHCYDGEPDMPGSRTYPPKWVVTEYERLMRRVRKSKRIPAKP